MRIRFNGQPFTITKTLSTGETDRYIRCKIYDLGLNDVTTELSGGPYVFLSHVANGLYGNAGITDVPDGQYVVIFEVFRDALYENKVQKYGIVEEDYVMTRFETRIINRVDVAESALTETIDEADGSAV